MRLTLITAGFIETFQQNIRLGKYYVELQFPGRVLLQQFELIIAYNVLATVIQV